jgi:hypothetical protein
MKNGHAAAMAQLADVSRRNKITPSLSLISLIVTGK